MKTSKIFTLALAGILLFNISCRNNDGPINEPPRGAYENGILIANEGGYTTPNASVSFLSSDFSKLENNIFATNNGNAELGKVFQSVGFKGDNAYLVTNIPNKIEIVNRYTFKKTGTITSNIDNSRYIAFSGNYTYVTNNNFSDVRKLNIYDSANSFVKSISFDRYAEKVVEASGVVYVQTDGVKYDSGNELPTGHTITRINPANNSIDKTITLTDDAIIRDMMTDNNGNVYVLSSDYNNSYVYKIDARLGTVEQTKLVGVSAAQKLAIDNGKIYFLTADKKLYSFDGNVATPLFDLTAAYVYGFNVIDGKVYVSDPSFTKDNTVRIYNLSGAVVKTFTAGVGTNGFYKN